MTTSTPSVLTPEVKKRLYVFAKKLAKKTKVTRLDLQTLKNV